MYDDHFGLTGRPFQLTPDPRFWFETDTHRKAMAYLGYGLAQGEGFIVITGDIGAGKTTLVGHLMDTLDQQRLNPIKIVSTAIEASDLLRIVATALGVQTKGMEKADLLIAIERGLHAVARAGKRTLLIVDEAQALPVASLEELRMLSNFQAGGHAMLQIVLLGQPEFRDRLHGEDRLEQMRQRVIAIHHLDPMEAHEVSDYIAHRLAVVGWTGRPDFTEDAFDAFYRGSGGVPRRLNLLAGRTMLHAAIGGIDLIDGATVDAVIRDLHADLPMPMPIGAPLADAPAPMKPEPVERLAAPAAAAPVIVTPMPAPASATPVREAPAPTEEVKRPSWFESATAPVARPAPRVVLTPEPQPEPIVVPPEAEADCAPEPEAEPAVVSPDPTLVARIAALEAQVEQQEVALRRVLTLLVDWVETDAQRPPYAPIRNFAA